MIPRILEPEVMDTAQEAADYDAMDHSTVNRVFVDDLLAALRDDSAAPPVEPVAMPVAVLDVGTGTALVPIELCRREGCWHVTAIDLAGEMIALAARNVAAAGLKEQIVLARLDAKRLPFPDGRFHVVMCNSIVHHIPEPRAGLTEMLRLVAPGGLLFVRDLMRPDRVDRLDELVSAYARDANERQRGLFRASLHAALTLDEMRSLAIELGLDGGCVRQTSDRHWTLCQRDPGSPLRRALC